MLNNPLFLYIDLFCGKSHWRNHPGVKHFEEDIRTLDISELNKANENF